MSGMDDMIQSLVAAVAGGGGVAWLSRVLLGRMVSDYDKRHENHGDKIESMSEKVSASTIRIAVLESILEDTRRLRIDLEQRASSMRGEFESRFQTAFEEMESLRRDLFVAHERIRLLASGDSDLSKVQAPAAARRR